MMRQQQPAMNRELEMITLPLCRRASELSTAGRENFMTTEANRTLSTMVSTSRPERAGAALIAIAGHKSPVVRAVVSSHLAALLASATADGGGGEGAAALRAAVADAAVAPGRMAATMRSGGSGRRGSGTTPSGGGGEGWVLGAFKAGAAFLDEGAPKTRANGKLLVLAISDAAGGPAKLGALCAELQPATLQQKVADVLKAAKGGGGGGSGGAGAAAGGGAVAVPPWKAKKPGRGARQAAPVVAAATASAAPSGGGAPVAAGASAARLSSVEMLTALSSKDFEERLAALNDFEADAAALASLDEAARSPLLDALTQRLMDGNAKVSAQALQALAACARADGGGGALSGSLIMLVPAVSAGLGSNKADVSAAAHDAADALVGAADSAAMVQHLSGAVGSGPPLKSRVATVGKLQAAIGRVDPKAQPKLAARWALPAAMSLAKDGKNSPEGRAAISALLDTLAAALGPAALMDQAASLPAPVRNSFKEAADRAAAAAGGARFKSPARR
eukprot:191462-Chlamydomonas_euryale.AAC.1